MLDRHTVRPREAGPCRARAARGGWPVAILATLAATLAPLLLARSQAAERPRAFRLEDILAFRTVGELRTSPDGTRAAFTLRTADLAANRFDTDMWLVALDGSAPARRLTFAGPVSSPRWSPDGTQIAFLARRGDSEQVFALPLAGGEAVALTAHAEPVAAFDWAPDGLALLIVAPAAPDEEEARRKKEKDDAYALGAQWRNHRIWRVSLPDGSIQPLTDGRRHVESAVWSPDGRRIAFVTTPSPEADSDLEARVEVLEVSTGEAWEVPGGERASRLAWSPDGRALAFVRPFDGRGFSRRDLFLWTLDAPTPRNLSSALDRDVEALHWSREHRSLDLLHARGAVDALARVDVGRGRVDTAWSPTHPLAALERAGAGWVYVPGGAPHEVWTASQGGAGARRLTEVNAAASGLELPRMEIVRWKGPVGEVEGVLVLPYGHGRARRHPLIVIPHGGPRSHSQASLDPLACYFAALGFVALRPNFRGSTGYGDAFAKANVGDWGDGPFRDLMAGVDRLVADGLADPERLFLYGWSYGGYLTNWAITHTGRFRAAASGAGVADLRMQYVISDARRWRFDYFDGSPFAGHWPIYQKESPITYAREAKVPTLFIHGAEDVRCPLPQGLMMHRALKDAGIETELVVYPREGHGFREPRHILDRAKRVAEWFRRFDTARRP